MVDNPASDAGATAPAAPRPTPVELCLRLTQVDYPERALRSSSYRIWAGLFRAPGLVRA